MLENKKKQPPKYLKILIFVLYRRLTATVEPFFPTPPANITEKMYQRDQTPHTIVIKTIKCQISKLPKS